MISLHMFPQIGKIVKLFRAAAILARDLLQDALRIYDRRDNGDRFICRSHSISMLRPPPIIQGSTRIEVRSRWQLLMLLLLELRAYGCRNRHARLRSLPRYTAAGGGMSRPQRSASRNSVVLTESLSARGDLPQQ